MIKKYRKKPVVVEAVKLEKTIQSVKKVCEFIGGDFNSWDKKNTIDNCDGVEVCTNHGVTLANWGDYIIKGDDFYPCKPDVFESSYEEDNEWWIPEGINFNDLVPIGAYYYSGKEEAKVEIKCECGVTSTQTVKQGDEMKCMSCGEANKAEVREL